LLEGFTLGPTSGRYCKEDAIMPKTIWVQVQFVKLHQKAPPDYGPKPNLRIGSFDTGIEKYSFELSKVDPDGRESGFGGDVSEFQIVGVSYDTPVNYSARSTYQTEYGPGTYNIWQVVYNAPDDLYVPPDIPVAGQVPSGDPLISTTLSEIADNLIAYGQARGWAAADLAEELKSSAELYKTLADHMTTQFDLIDKVLNGQVDLATFEQLSGKAAVDLELELVAMAADDLPDPIPDILVEAVRQLITYAQSKTTDPNSPPIVDTSTSGEIFAVLTLSSYNSKRVIGSPGNDSIYHEGTVVSSVITAGAGNDILSTVVARDVYSGGSGTDTLNYQDEDRSLVIDLGYGSAYVSGDFNGTIGADRFVGFENAVGGQLGDLVNGNAEANTLEGIGGADALNGSDGNDTLWGGSGNDRVDGGSGIDTASFGIRAFGTDSVGYNFATADVSYEPSKITVAGFVPGRVIINRPDELDEVTGVERFQFSDGTIDRADGDPLIDDLYYLGVYRDVWNAKFDAEAHYEANGWRESRNPNAFFQTNAYLSLNSDVAVASINPIEHYRSWGWREGRDPSALFDTELYLLRNPDVKAAGLNPLAHYLEFGFWEGREIDEVIGKSITSGFDREYYLLRNPDVGAAQLDAFQHYVQWGWKEGRDPNSYFDTDWYLGKYPDVAAAGINPLEHYMQWGWKEGRDPSLKFDTSSYLTNYADVAAAGINPLQHYLTFGVYEGRQDFGFGDRIFF
jgi:hypothetical protein